MSDNIEVRDEIARMTGWEWGEFSHRGWEWGEFSHRMDKQTGWHKVKFTPDGEEITPSLFAHPIPNTLDEAAKLPEGWWWEKRYNLNPEYVAGEVGRGASFFHVDTGDEKAARFFLRLAVLKHMAAQEPKQ